MYFDQEMESMEKNMSKDNRVARYILLLLLAALLSISYHFLIVHKAVVDLEVDTDGRTIFKVYWAGEGELFSEKKMARINISPIQNAYSFRICDLGNVTKLRIDTSERPARVNIKAFSVRQQGYPVIYLKNMEDFYKLQVLEGVKKTIIDENGFTVIPENNDPQLLFRLPPLTRSLMFFSELLQIGCIVLFVFFLAVAIQGIISDYNYVPYLAVFVFALIVVMAAVSKYNMHPDEFVHIYAAEYYQNNIFPPQIGSQEILHTYSNYGVSRLHSGEIVYLLAGKFQKILAPFHIQSFLTLRFFNIVLFSILILLAVTKVEFRLMMLPLMISPQIWYIFSYFNSDAFAFFIIMLVGYQVAVPSSMFHRLLSRNFDIKLLAYLFSVGVLFGLLLLLKKNFYFFYVFLFLYVVWSIIFGKIILNKKTIIRFGMIVLVGLSLFGAVKGTDYAVNGFDKKDKLLEAREKIALDMYKPSTPLAQKHGYLQMKDRGVTLKHFLQINRWGEKSFRTSFGVYGYMSVAASFFYYDIVRSIGLGLLLLITVSILLRGGKEGNSLFLIALTVTLGLIITAMYHAWTVDFQAQGRYFLPIVAIGSILLYHTERYLYRPFFQWFVMGLYLLSVYNFVFVGLHDIAKYGT